MVEFVHRHNIAIIIANGFIVAAWQLDGDPNTWWSDGYPKDY
jgi:hypothetical protein